MTHGLFQACCAHAKQSVVRTCFCEAAWLFLQLQRHRVAQVYATSIMFGYFVRRVDKRFQLERSLGLLEGDNSDAVQRLERLFARVSHATAYASW